MAESESLLVSNNGREVVLGERKSEATERKTTIPSSHVVSLDVFRGLCVFVGLDPKACDYAALENVIAFAGAEATEFFSRSNPLRP